MGSTVTFIGPESHVVSKKYEIIFYLRTMLYTRTCIKRNIRATSNGLSKQF